MKQFTQQIFTVSLRLLGKGYCRLVREATQIALWSLAENVVCWEHWDNLYTENIEASVALLEELVEKLNDHSLKLLSSPSDTLTLTQTMKSFRLKNKKAISERGYYFNPDYYYYKEADEYCKLISGRLSCRSISLKGTCIIAVILVTAVATLLHLFYLRVFGF
ncbi:hypothetical protein V5N11_024316 [Cardamine amara subsp. amara]|uniref:Uncharacterized protein n=1 Tax=Cardamine amara subsp. amara TaxID=228776 RepID=A0ABD1BA21_CARAN